jgi:dihydroorotate dehydrogenase (NAD+) catalytic subunit
VAIELAPHNKQGLPLNSPLIAGSGAVGFGDAWPPGVTPALFGAIVTAPLTLHRHRGQRPPRLAELPGGFLLATGDHNPGYPRVLRDYASEWTRLGIPLLVALAASTPEDWPRLAAHLEEETESAGVELAIPADTHRSEAAAWVSAVRHAVTLPVLAKLPVAQAGELAEACVQAGADALVLGTPPQGAYPAADGTVVEAQVSGPIAFPFTLRAVRAVAALALDIPLVAAGGIGRPDDVRLCLSAGATAVQVRSLLWTDPAAVVALATAAQSI